MEDISHDFVPRPIGTRQDLIRNICEVVPFADFTDPAWGSIDGPGFWIEVHMGREERVTSCSFDLHGSDKSVGIVADILDYLGLRALDTSGSVIFDPDSAFKGMQA